jgi:hypothetical protein
MIFVSAQMQRALVLALLLMRLTVAHAQQTGSASSGPGGIPATSNVLKGTGAVGNSTAASPLTDYVATGAVSPKQFGAYGDGNSIANGCSTTLSSATLVCPGGPFFASDVGKTIYVSGSGASGVTMNAVILTYTSATTVTMSASASKAVTQNYTVYGHDDSTALQSCFAWSANNQVQCVLNSPTGYLVGTAGLLMVNNTRTIPTLPHSGINVTGSSGVSGTNLWCEYNGDCLSLAAGPVQGANFSNINIKMDPNVPNGRGIHLNAAVGIYGDGGLWNSNFTNVEVDNPAKECLWMDGGGGTGYTYNLPNQIDTFTNFQCNGPNQSHPANLIKITGQAAQILFMNGQTNGNGYSGGSSTEYPNWLIYLGEKTSGLSDSPGDVKFYGYTYEVGTQGLYVGEGTTNIHYDNSYVENVSTPLEAVTTYGLTFNGNHIANSGNITAVANFLGQVNASMRDDFIYGTTTPAALATCANNNNSIDFASIVSTVMTTSHCGTNQQGTGTATINVVGTTEIVNPSATAITTINAPNVMPGKTLTLFGFNGSFTLNSGGNISFGGLSAPLTVMSGQSVTLTRYDLGPGLVITGTTAGVGYLAGTTSLATLEISSGRCQTVTAGLVNSSKATGASSRSKILWTPAVSLQSVSGYRVSTSGALSIDAYASAGYVNFNVCNPTSRSITPGALKLNWDLHP